MNIRLIRLSCTNFKGLKSFEADFQGENATIKAANGVGKTSVYDAWLWLLFGKDSTGRKDFQLRPLDEDKQPIKSLVVIVEAETMIDGVVYAFKKEHHEKIVKKQLTGYETLCSIDDVPLKVGEYQKYIANIATEDTFKLVTNLSHFNMKLTWQQRRAVLLDIAGEIKTPAGFEQLIEDLHGHSIEHYHARLIDRKKRYTKERDSIGPRCDELQRGLEAYAGADNEDQEQLRTTLKEGISKLTEQRKELRDQEFERQAKIDQLNTLRVHQVNREGYLRNDTSSVQKYIEEKTKIQTSLANLQTNLGKWLNIAEVTKGLRSLKEIELNNDLNKLVAIRNDFAALEKPSEATRCVWCGGKLPADKLAELETKRNKKLEDVSIAGTAAKQLVARNKADIAELQVTLKKQQDEAEKAQIELKEYEDYAAEEMLKLDELINTKQAPVYTDDAEWNKITADIQAITNEIGEPVSQQLETIDDQLTKKHEQLAKVNDNLAQLDRSKKDAARIKELEAEERRLSQQIADVEKSLATIGEYKAAESTLIEDAVNDKFSCVKFRLFNYLLNGEIQDTCEATINGVPYPDMSYGQRIIVGIDIINVLSEHYDLSACLFIDNAESVTYPLEAKSQTIELYAEEGLDELVVERK